MTRRLPTALAALAVLLVLPGAWLSAVLDYIDVVDLVVGVAFALLGVASAITGAVVATRVPDNGVGWIILGLGLGIGILLSTGAYGELGITTSVGPLPGQSVAVWVGDVAGIPVFFGLVGLLLLLFPTGQPISPAWRTGTWMFTGVVAVAFVSYGVTSPDVGSQVPNPFLVTGRTGDLLTEVASITDWLALPAMALAAASMVVRLRRSHGVERQQLKSFALVAVLAALGLGSTVVIPAGLVADLAFLVGLLGVAALPVTAGLAILRHGLYGIDVVIKSTLIYGPLTAVLLATYLGLVLLLQLLFPPLAGESDLAVAASTLAVAGLFRPLRSRIQDVVDRRFYRRRYDAARTLEGFAARLREELDLDSLGTDLRGVVSTTMQPAHVSLWLREEIR
ncbi:MAG: hypothetical protein AVDCRST_MAG72-1215 [uncultured Nocardioidaceae bacterium]|uniref:Uncharacterized protein n=1 Tax=uncultured Nocardioidaceae bacterium TaxID=253824 RepID=A0A6J4M1V1_9ACTN|nr:MAG: hypothetical protein AVDCRST_MAG72-1215 [uncultured Nocardioidaceae bacterium]